MNNQIEYQYELDLTGGTNTDTITIDLSNYPSTSTSTIDTTFSNYTITGTNGNPITFNSGTTTINPLLSDINIVTGPEAYLKVTEIEEMCNDYPALNIAYSTFKSMYDLVLQDYKGKKNV